MNISDAVFSYQAKVYYSKIDINGSLYQDVCCILEYGLDINNNSVVKVQLLDRKKQPIFKIPMFLITNIKVINDDIVYSIYRFYLQRSKIEGVFKFMKDVLGWEDSQIRSFEPMKSLLSFCFFITGYFYEIESTLINNEVIKFICELGGGMGKVTKNFVLRGLSKLLIKNTVESSNSRLSIKNKLFFSVANFGYNSPEVVLDKKTKMSPILSLLDINSIFISIINIFT